jgi:hypothetical protein
MKKYNMEYNNETGARMEELLETKSFDELTSSEKEFVLEQLRSEDKYNTLRKISAALVADTAGLSPDPRILGDLKKALDRKRKSTSIFRQVLGFKVPAYAVGMLLLFIAWFIGLNAPQRMSKPPEKSVAMNDTIFVKSASDTVFVERVIVKYLEPKAQAPSDFSLVKQEVADHQKTSPGVNMKEKEELESLLVTGS